MYRLTTRLRNREQSRWKLMWVEKIEDRLQNRKRKTFSLCAAVGRERTIDIISIPFGSCESNLTFLHYAD
jgi:hypothetical protein